MEEENVIKEEKKLVFAKKEVWISGVIGLLLGAIIMFLLYITGVPKFGNETIATVKGGSVKKNDLYNEMKKAYSVNYALDVVDSAILKNKYKLTSDQEKEIQDQFENLLIGADIDFEREGPHIDYSSKAYIPDFSFNSIDLAVEIKLCKTEEKTFIQQINDDILAYKTKFNNLLFIIYDLGVIRDVDTFKQSFEETENVIVHVIKH